MPNGFNAHYPVLSPPSILALSLCPCLCPFPSVSLLSDSLREVIIREPFSLWQTAGAKKGIGGEGCPVWKDSLQRHRVSKWLARKLWDLAELDWHGILFSSPPCSNCRPGRTQQWRLLSSSSLLSASLLQLGWVIDMYQVSHHLFGLSECSW